MPRASNTRAPRPRPARGCSQHVLVLSRARQAVEGAIDLVGFCMGGALSLASSVLVDGIDAGVAFYGICPDGLADPSNMTVPFQAHFGELDQMAGFSDPAAAAELEAKLRSSPAAANAEVLMYPGVGHAFMNDTPEGVERKLKVGQGTHDQAQVDLAWQRTVDFFGKNPNYICPNQ